jgi:D-lactate dehydrogenase (cytochrome)
MQTVKYGTVGDWVLELEAVLADGSVIETGSKAVKTAAGYDLTSLLVGSEGTLAVVTRATLRLAGIPEQIRGGRATFRTLDDATAAVSDAVTAGVDVAKIELIDATTAAIANAYSDTALPERPMVFLEFHADHGVAEEVAFCRQVFEAHDVETFETGDGARGSEMDDLWQARKDLAFAQEEYDPDLSPTHAGDVTVPISDYPDAVRYVQSLAEEYDLLVPTYGHAGDGNLHWAALVDEDDSDQVEAVEELYRRVVEFALERGGTSTGEHGVGMGKREYLVAEHGEAGVAAMRALKRALDPTGTLNPGKVFPDEAGDGGGPA